MPQFQALPFSHTWMSCILTGTLVVSAKGYHIKNVLLLVVGFIAIVVEDNHLAHNTKISIYVYIYIY